MLVLIGLYAFIFAVDTFISSYLIWLYCNKLVLRYVCLRVSDLGQVLISQPGIVLNYYIIINIINYKYLIIFIYIHIFPFYLILFSAPCVIK